MKKLLFIVPLLLSTMSYAGTPQVIVTKNNINPIVGTRDVTYLYWVPVPNPAYYIPIPNGQSAWCKAQASENNAIAVGSTLEVIRSTTIPSSISESTIATYLQSDYTNYVSSYNAQTQGHSNYFWDGTSWTQRQ